MTSPYAFQSDQALSSMTADTALHAGHATHADTADIALTSLPDTDWIVTDSILFTTDFRGIVRGGAGNAYSGDSAHTTINLGVACTTSGYHSTIGGGHSNRATANSALVSGGTNNRATGLWATVSGGIGNSATGISAYVGSGSNNQAGGTGATVGGGTLNRATGEWSVVTGGGGQLPGDGNAAVGDYSVVVGGNRNRALGQYASVLGGGGGASVDSNVASGDYATTVGGRGNVAEGAYSVAMGKNAWAANDNAFVWSDGSSGSLPFPSLGNKTFTVVASGGFDFYSALGGLGVPATGVELSPGSGAWSSLSSRAAKDDIKPVDGAAILAKVAQLPISEWRYKSQADSIHHIGPMAQDFYRLFRLGDSDEMICAVDPDGVALAAIQELHKRNLLLEAEVAELRDLLNTLVKGCSGQ